MKSIFCIKLAGLAAVTLCLVLGGLAHADTNFVVTTPSGDFYVINGAPATNTSGLYVNNCQPLTVYAGNTYTFTMMAASFHPMVVATNAASSGLMPAADFAYTNASPQAVFSGTITLTIPPTNFPSHLYYQCNIHGFYGVITVLPPLVEPPQNRIVGLSVTTNIVLLSTGTNTSFVLVPQFSSNLDSGVWAPVQNFTNTFANGTNRTVFDRLDPICGPNVFLRISQQPPN